MIRTGDERVGYCYSWTAENFEGEIQLNFNDTYSDSPCIDSVNGQINT